MSYIGKEPEFTQYPSKFFYGVGTAMTVSLDYATPNDAALLVFIDGVRQDTSAYNCTGTSLTFTGSVPSGTNNVQVVHMGLVVDVGVPADDTISTAKIQDDAVTTAKIADNNVTLAKLEDGTQGDILYYGASGAPARLGFGTDGYFLKTQGTGANPAWAEVPPGAPTGGGTEKVFFNNEVQVDSDYTVPSGFNSVSAGPVTVASGVTVTISSGSAWVIV